MILKIHTPADRLKVKEYLDKLPDKKFVVEIKRAKEIRSMSSNRLYWLWLNCIQAETGNLKEDLHDYFAEKYLPRVTTIFMENEIEKPISTTKLDSKKFGQYLERVQQFANIELGVILPNPEDMVFNEFVEAYRNYI